MTVYTPETASKVLLLSRKTIYRLIERGEINVARVGRSIRITQDEIRRVLCSTKSLSSSSNGCSPTVGDGPAITGS